MSKIYKTSRGVTIDMDAIRLAGESSPAVGNMNVNSRGDKLGRGGKVTATVEKQTRAYHRTAQKAVKTVSIKEDIAASDAEMENMSANMPKVKKTPKPAKTISKSREVELEDGSIEIADDED